MVTRTKKKTAKKKATKKTGKATKKVAKKATGKKPAANSKWSDSLKPVILNLARRGKTNSEIAMLLGVCEATFYYWLKNYAPDLSESLKEAIADPVSNVEKALYERAMGYSCQETKVHMTKSGVIKTRDVIKHYPPSETAMKYYLGNKKPEDWKEKREVEVTGDEPTRNLSLAFNCDEDPAEVDARGGDEPGE